MNKKQISVYIDPELHKELKKKLIDKGMTVSDWFEEQAKKLVKK